MHNYIFVFFKCFLILLFFPHVRIKKAVTKTGRQTGLYSRVRAEGQTDGSGVEGGETSIKATRWGRTLDYCTRRKTSVCSLLLFYNQQWLFSSRYVVPCPWVHSSFLLLACTFSFAGKSTEKTKTSAGCGLTFCLETVKNLVFCSRICFLTPEVSIEGTRRPVLKCRTGLSLSHRLLYSQRSRPLLGFGKNAGLRHF